MENTNKSVQNVDDCNHAMYIVSEIYNQLLTVCRAYGGEGWQAWYTEEIKDASAYSMMTGRMMTEVLRLRINSIIENRGRIY